MDFESLLLLGQTALENGLVISLCVLALYLSYRMLGVCDLSTDGCFTLGAAVGAVVALSGHPYLAIIAAMGAGMLSGIVVSLLQTVMGIDSLLSGIIVNTGLYSVVIAVMGGSSLLNLNKAETVFTKLRSVLPEGPAGRLYKIIILVAAAALVILFYSFFLRTRLGLALRATGNNPDMVRSSSINPSVITIIGLAVSGSVTALSGCLLAQMQKSVTADIGQGMVTVALASLLIGTSFMSKKGVTPGAIGAVLGSVIFRLVYTVALRFNMPAFMLKLISSVIVIVAIFIPYVKSRYPSIVRRLTYKRKEDATNA